MESLESQFWSNMKSTQQILISSPQSRQFDAIKFQIQEFEKSLDDTREVGLMLASFGTNVTMAVSDISYDGDVFVFHGLVNGSRSKLLQHRSQLNFLLLALPRQEPAEFPKRQIGFVQEID